MLGGERIGRFLYEPTTCMDSFIVFIDVEYFSRTTKTVGIEISEDTL